MPTNPKGAARRRAPASLRNQKALRTKFQEQTGGRTIASVIKQRTTQWGMPRKKAIGGLSREPIGTVWLNRDGKRGPVASRRAGARSKAVTVSHLKNIKAGRAPVRSARRPGVANTSGMLKCLGPKNGVAQKPRVNKKSVTCPKREPRLNKWAQATQMAWADEELAARMKTYKFGSPRQTAIINSVYKHPDFKEIF